MAAEKAPSRPPEADPWHARYAVIHSISGHIARVLMQVVRYGAFVLMFRLGADAYVAGVGHTTVADVSVSAAFGVSGAWSLCLWPVGVMALATIIAVAVARGQAKLRGDAIERMHHYQRLYELRHDKNRTSSDLTPKGDTRPEDL